MTSVPILRAPVDPLREALIGVEAPLRVSVFDLPAGETPAGIVYDGVLLFAALSKYRIEARYGTRRWRRVLMIPDLVSLIKPGEAHDVRRLDPASFITVALPPSAFRAALDEEMAQDLQPVALGRPDANVARLALRLSEVGGRRDPDGRLMAEGYAHALIARLARLDPQIKRHFVGSPVGLSASRLQCALEAIHARLEEGPTVAAVAAAVGLSPWRFSGAFRAAIGETPQRYILRARVERAKTLMSRMSATETAFHLGFTDPAHFSRTFKAVTGLTPTAWRRMVYAGRNVE